MRSPETQAPHELPPLPDITIGPEGVTLFHGSPVRDIDQLEGAIDTTIGEGVYFTPIPEPAIGYAYHRADRGSTAAAGQYAPTLYSANIANVRLLDLRTEENAQWLLEFLEPKLRDQRAASADWMEQGRLDLALKHLATGTNHGNLKFVLQSIGTEVTKDLSAIGYDGLVAWEGGEGTIGNHESWLIFNPSSVSSLSSQPLTAPSEKEATR